MGDDHLFGIKDGVIPRTETILQLTDKEKLNLLLSNQEVIINSLFNLIYSRGTGSTKKNINTPSGVFSSELNETPSANSSEVFSSEIIETQKTTSKKGKAPDGVFEV